MTGYLDPAHATVDASWLAARATTRAFGSWWFFDLPEVIPASQSEDELKTVNQRERFLVILDQFRRGLCWDNSLHRWNILVDELHFYSTG